MSQWHLKQGVLDAVAERPATFNEIVDASDGAYPLDVQECVSALVKEGALEAIGNYYQATRPPSLPSSTSTEGEALGEVQLPPPHPLDYDWRFAQATRDILVSTILHTPPTRRALLLGTPSLLQPLAQARPSITSALLLDSNSSLARAFDGRLPYRFEFIQHNLLTDPLFLPQELVSAVVVDPPWYFAHYAAFLAQAVFAARAGATILLSLLPLNTRPDAPTERAMILELAFSLGLNLRELRRSALGYVSPPFERAALSAQGLSVREDWRRGDLAVFSMAETVDRSRLEAIRAKAIAKDPLLGADLGWHEFEIAGRKIKIRGPFDDEAHPRLVSVEEGDIMPTVSRRYRSRGQIDLWLWDNRVFAVQGKRVLFSTLARLSGSPISFSGSTDPEKLKAAESLVLSLLGGEDQDGGGRFV